ncbi:MAG: YafY family transcriptional regulator [Verrucomicrobia bacterium]|nr:YafY family transcriptional regulator [Verrucomicrobiota bacterium]
MNRTDRLVALVMLLQSRRVVTAAEMAAHFEITERTVYRDLAALGEGGVPIVGEPGVGYRLMRGYQLPPVMFTSEEAFALVTGGMLAERMTDESVRERIRTALGKVTAVLPADLQGRVERLGAAMQVRARRPGAGPVPLCRLQLALAERRVLRLRYRALEAPEATERMVEPLALVFYLDHWHLFAWCRLREAVRDFRVDRIASCEVLAEPTPPRPDFNLGEHLAFNPPADSYVPVVLEFHPRLMQTVRRNWGPTLLAEEPTADGWVRAELACFEERYLARWLLSAGPLARIVEPESFRASVLEAARECLAHHAPPGPSVDGEGVAAAARRDQIGARL